MYNKNSGYGRLIAEKVSFGLTAGKTFIVAKAAVAYRDIYADIFDVDPTGAARVFATIDAAIGACTANSGDTIFVLPGHTETVTSTSIAHDVAGIQIIGLGQGAMKPVLTFSTAAATITVTAANGLWKNFRCIANFADVAAAFTLGATSTDFQIRDCEFTETSADLNWFNIVVTGSTNNASDGLTVVGNFVHQQDAAAKAFISILGNCERVLVTDNIVVNNSTADAAQFMTLSSKVLLGARVMRNVLHIVGASHAVNVGAFVTGSSTTSSGVFSENRVGMINSATALFATTGQGFVYFENYITKIADKSGLILPAIV